jgi:Zn-dependent protease
LALALGLILKIAFQAGLFEQLLQGSPLFQVLNLIVWVNLALGIFNLLPLPPLDGFQILAVFLPASWSRFLGNYYFISLIIFICLAYFGVFSRLLRPMLISLFSVIYS